MSYQLNRYVTVKNIFNYIVSLQDPAFCNMTSFKENKDALALWLSVKRQLPDKDQNNKQLDYYYKFGDLQVHRYIDDKDPRVLGIDEDKLYKHILMEINDFIRGKVVA